MADDTGRMGRGRCFWVRAFALGLCLFAYVVLGLYTELKLVGVKPLPEKLIEDFQYYKWAFDDALEVGDPYTQRDIGTGFLYPPPALLVVGAFAYASRLGQQILGLDHFLLRAALLTATNIFLLSLVIYGVARRYGYTLAEVLWWFPLGLGFAPFLELLHLGQINVITQFGVFLMFVLAESAPGMGGLGLSLGVITKVTPLAFVGYLLAGRNLKAILGAAGGLALLSLLAGLLFGWRLFPAFFDVFAWLLEAFPLGPNAQSLVALLASHGLIAAADAPTLQRALVLYLLAVFAASAAAAYLSRQREPLFIVLSLGLALMPNVLWYHHYVFFLLPVFVWLGWSRKHPAVAAWCFLGLLLIQVDRQYSLLEASHGLLAHAFGHLSILAILAWQVRRTWGLLRHGPGLRALLRWG